jgi:hypothetical protein
VLEVPVPSTPIPFPEALTGTLTGPVTCVPLPTPLTPEVVGAPDEGADAEDAGEPDVAGAPWDALPVPSAPTPFPVMVTGTLTTGATCVPEAVPWLPVVEAAGAVADGAAAGAEAAAAGAGAVVARPVPATPIPFPDTVTGRLTVGTACVPERSPAVPLVDATGAVAGALDEGEADDDDCVEEPWPRTPRAFPVAETGAPTVPTTCVPEAVPSAPEVVAAFAATAPPSDIPPTRTVNHSPLETHAFMRDLLIIV